MTLVDCSTCSAPVPLGQRCPHCGAAPKRTSLRGVFLGVALASLAGTSMAIGCSYGMAGCVPTAANNDCGECNPKAFATDGGVFCECDKFNSCAVESCAAGIQCVNFIDGGPVGACPPGATCSCGVGNDGCEVHCDAGTCKS